MMQHINFVFVNGRFEGGTVTANKGFSKCDSMRPKASLFLSKRRQETSLCSAQGCDMEGLLQPMVQTWHKNKDEGLCFSTKAMMEKNTDVTFMGGKHNNGGEKSDSCTASPSDNDCVTHSRAGPSCTNGEWIAGLMCELCFVDTATQNLL